MDKFRRFAAAVIAVLLLPAAVLAEKVEINKSTQLVAQSEQFELRSDKIGEDFLIQVGLPASYGSADKRYPVVYLLDGNTSFGAATDIARRLVHDLIEPGIPEVIVVGIGYVKAERMMGLRTRDLTPKGSVPQSYHEMTDHLFPFKQTSGGADDFLAFIENEVDSVIRKRYQTDGGKAGILGNSFGGLFTYYAFLKQSPLFDKYWFGSPGLIEEDTRLLDDLPALLQKTDFKGQRIYISVGERELHHSFYGPLGRNYAKMVEAFETYPGQDLSMKSQVFLGATHTSVMPAALTQALLYLYADR